MRLPLITLSSVLLLGSVSYVGCGTTRRNTERGAAVGAATGAVIGGIIGHQSGEAASGAAVGAAAGGLAGGAYGHRQDREERAEANRTAIPATDDYLSLMTSEEVATLQARARASGRSNYQLTDFLTEAEKENLRRRAAQRREIGQ